MRILHLTDLHLTEVRVTLDDLWAGAERALRGQRPFDFVVISGDLTQSAKPEEYDSVLAFLAHELASDLVRDGDRRRVVIVPGNHDVDRSCGEIWDASFKPGPDDARRAMRDPEGSSFRIVVGADGAPAVRKINEARYWERFKTFDDFIERFYQPAGPAPTKDKRMNFAAGQDWCVARFEAEGVAFFGFNSCHRLDGGWNGASFRSKAITEAQRHRTKHCVGLLSIAVWHHGLYAKRGGADLISDEELGALANAGFELGVHGHTHAAELTELKERFRYRFPIVATGTFAAGHKALPAGETRQCSVIDLTRGRVRWSLVRRDESNGQWTRDPVLRYLLLPAPGRRALQSESHHARRYSRDVSLDDDGIATVRVTLEGVDLSEPRLTLASIEGGFAAVDADATAQVWRGDDMTDGAQRRWSVTPTTARVYTLDAAKHLDLKGDNTAQKVLWGYRIANNHALEVQDTLLDPNLRPEGMHLESGWDVVVQRVGFDIDRLELALSRGAPHTDWIERFNVRVESVVEGRWREHEAETKRARTALKYADGRLAIALDDPLPEHRYALLYKPRAHREPLGDIEALLTALLRECRTQRSSFRQKLVDVMREPLERKLGAPSAAGEPLAHWVVHLWDANERALLAAFGEFPPHVWGTRFGHGSGIAGHAFRRNGPALYLANARGGSTSSLIYRSPETATREASGLSVHDWILCLPLLCPVLGVPVGVLGFASEDSKRTVEARLKGLSERALASATSSARDVIGGLASEAQAAFWRALRAAAVEPEFEQWKGEIEKRVSVYPGPILSRPPSAG